MQFAIADEGTDTLLYDVAPSVGLAGQRFLKILDLERELISEKTAFWSRSMTRSFGTL